MDEPPIQVSDVERFAIDRSAERERQGRSARRPFADSPQEKIHIRASEGARKHGTLNVNVSGQRLVQILLTANITALTLSDALDGQVVTLEFQQNGTGGYTVASAQIPGLTNPASAANAVSSQSFQYTALTNTWTSVPNPGGISQALTAAGAVSPTPGLVTLGGASAQAYTLVAPPADGIVMKFSIISAHAHTLTTPPDGINSAYDTVTFAAVGDAIELQSAGGVWYVVGAHGTATLSEV